MKLEKKIENKIKHQVIALLEKGKPGWDIPHTLDAVQWIKKLIKTEGGNERILIPAIYFHDTGYPSLKKGYNFNKLMISKKDHADVAAENCKIILPDLGFTNEETKRIVYLVKNHDIHNNITEADRQLIFEADGFAQVNWNVTKPTFDKHNTEKFFAYFIKERVPFIKTKTGLNIIKKLQKEAEEYLDKWPE